jgi:hypothetical protein
VVADLARIFAVAGKAPKAKKIFKKLQDASREHYISPVNYAKIYESLGKTDEFFEYLEKGVEERAVRLPYLLIDPQYDAVRDDERFEELIRKIHAN